MAPNATHTANSIRQSDCNVLKKEVKQLEIGIELDRNANSNRK
uniref:Uncharacterized protein n=1 Tax=Tetraselmis sp. GSL018 TaxID=582737 RepID=A0A061SP57_9CHLO